MKHDKVVVTIGVIILLIAGVGIYLYKPAPREGFLPSGKALVVMEGVLKDSPSAIEVADTNPFYPLIVTPLAVHYDENGNRHVVPLYVKNMSGPSKAIIRAEEMIGKNPDLVITENRDPRDVSLDLIKEYWKKSDLALIIKDDQEGYETGLVATPIASYLTAPVIVTDQIDSEVLGVLSKIDVRYLIICGNLTTDVFNSYHIENADDALNITIELVEEKFGDIDYITMTNPLDAWPPRVLDKVFYSSPVMEIGSTVSTQIFRMFMGLLTGSNTANFSFKIPDDYKYALIKVEVVNLDSDGVDEFGNKVSVQGGIMDPSLPETYQKFELISFGVSTASNPAIRDSAGRIIKDRFYQEVLLYNRGGARYNLVVSGEWLDRKSGRVQINVEVDKLENPYYAMMKKLSSLAPYLTAYHKGIIFARPDFAFYADDNALTIKGEKCPGYYSVRKNPDLAYAHNMHVFNKIHKPLNKLLAKLADIPADDIRNLREYYKNNPIYIAILGDAEMMPRIVYDNWLCPLSKEASSYTYAYGLGTPSDFIYGDIDPIYGDYSNLANDTCSYYPYQENIVGRLAGWDVQDVSALIVRTFFYNDIIERLGDWKNRATVLVGGGQDFQRPPIRYLISRITGNSEEAVKLPTGFGKIMMERTKEKVLEPMGFKVTTAYDYEAAAVGYSMEALSKIKKSCLLNRLIFFKNFVAKYVGEDVAKGKEYMESSNFIWANAHGQPHMFGMCGPSILGLGWFGPIFRWIAERTLSCIDGGFLGPGYSLSAVGDYTPRRVAEMELGPSVMWIDSCLCGKITGVYPQNSISMAFIHAGVNTLISASVESNIAGGYLEPKKHIYDTPWSVARAYINTTLNAKKGIYPEPHFAYLMYQDMCQELMKNKTIGLAFRNARNLYLYKDANATFWWSPPLVATGNPLLDFKLWEEKYDQFVEMFGSKKTKVLPNKYFEFQEWQLYGDPAFNPYIPGEEQ